MNTAKEILERLNSIGEELVCRTKDSNPPTSDSNPPTSNSNPPTLSTDLQERINRIGKRTRDKKLLLEIVVELCTISPLSISEIARLIHRTDNYVKHDLVAPLRERGVLKFTIPDMINHPDQKYQASLSDGRKKVD